MIQNRRAYQLIHCHTRSRLLAGAAAVCGAACGHADLGLYHLLHRGGAPLPDSTQADRAALAALCPKPAAEETCPLLPQQDPAVTLSVIVPVYNGEATIGPCLDSILQQDTGCTVQLIVVDSDSTDGTAAVLERYRALPGVLLCNCSAPRSAAAARNEGLRHAVGRWLMFVDSDDLLLPGAIRTLLEAAQRLDADVVQGGWQYLYTDGTRGPVQRYPAAVYTGAAAPERFELPGMPWGKVYRRELFAQVRFPAYYTCFEDAIIHFLVFRLAKTVASVPEMVYLWRKNPKGLTATSQHRPAAVQSYWINVNCHRLANIATPCQVIIKTEDCRFANIFDFHFPDFGADEVVIHIQVINVGGLLQTDLVLFPKIVHVIQTQIASGAADTITLIAVDFRFLLTQFA